MCYTDIEHGLLSGTGRGAKYDDVHDLLQLPSYMSTTGTHLDGPAEFVHIWDVRWNILACGTLSSAADIMSSWGQKKLPAASSAIIMAMEAPLSTLGGMWFLNETWTLREVLGMSSMLLAAIVAHLGPTCFTKPSVFTSDISRHGHYNSLPC